MAGLVIAVASPLIALARVNGLAWLPELFGCVLVPQIVAGEVLTGTFPSTEASIQKAISAGWLQLVDNPAPEPALPDLDEGEAACLRLALSFRSEALVLMDERAGRSVAQELGIEVADTAAVIGMAKKKGLIPSARAVFGQLHASDFRIAPAVIKAVLSRCDEG
jgi:predicted nucleic acid-binding protein